LQTKIDVVTIYYWADTLFDCLITLSSICWVPNRTGSFSSLKTPH